MATRIYVVVSGDTKRLVRASNKSQAVHHVARATITAEVADQDTLLELSKIAEVEVAGAEPGTPE